jgi:hypothetical protein
MILDDVGDHCEICDPEIESRADDLIDPEENELSEDVDAAVPVTVSPEDEVELEPIPEPKKRKGKKRK